MKRIELSPNPGSGARLVGYLHDKEEQEMPNRLKRPCVVVCPGGGYEFCSAREADPVAFAFFARGYNAFLLYYSVGKEAGGLRPLVELSRSVMKIRENSGEWGIFPEKIAVCGFSAGGHLAASLGTLWNSPALKEKLGGAEGNNRPDALILGYSVISAGEFAHRSSLEWVSGDSVKYRELLSLEKQVTPETPPAFLWHTADDDCVPVENTLLFAAALQRNHVPFECHIYPHGNHGSSMCNAEVNSRSPHLATWFPLCAEWLGELFGFEY